MSAKINLMCIRIEIKIMIRLAKNAINKEGVKK
jgi:hypothetical protein